MPVFLGHTISLQFLLDKAFLSCLGFSASGWLTFVVAFGANIFSLDPVVRSVSFLFVPWYIAACAGPVFYVLVGIYYLLNGFKIGKLFGGACSFIAIIYIAALSAPMFSVATLIAGTVGAVEDFVDIIDIADDVDQAINLGPFDSMDESNILLAVIRLVVGFIRAVLYFIVVFFFERFVTGIRVQFIGSFTAIFFMALAMMTWPFRHNSRMQNENKKLC